MLSGFVKPKPTPAITKLKSKRATRQSMPAIPSTIIALIDSDIDPRHRALKHRLWLNNSEKLGAGSYDDDLNGFVDDLRGWNFVADNNDVSDDLGHGTQVAGIITSQLRNQPSISILPLKALNDTGSGTIADVVEAMDYAVARRASVINCSFGSPAFSQAMLEAIKRAETAGIVVIAAAGNRGKSLSESPFYPASYRIHQASNLISVAATNRDNLLAGFSNYPADIAAPGENIRTAHRGNSYVRLTGTSASAGFVAATAGLLKSIRGFVSAQTIRDTILKSARESFDLKDKVASKGSINKVAALSLFTRNDRNITTSSRVQFRPDVAIS
jgi:subtilisin family serine protease